MRIKSIVIGAALLGLGALSSVFGQSEKPKPQPPEKRVAPNPVTRPMAEGLNLRAEITRAAIEGKLPVGELLAQLRSAKSPSGLSINADVDVAYAAIDIGRRLIAAGKPEIAETFFAEAEKALDKAIKNKSESTPKEKAQWLGKLAGVRGTYLGKTKEAQADIEAALVLQPEDKMLKRVQKTLSTPGDDVLKNNRSETQK